MALLTGLVIIVLVIGAFFVVYQLMNNKKEEAFSSTSFTSGIGLIVNSFGTMQDKILPAIALIRTNEDGVETILDKTSTTNYVQLVVGFILIILGLAIRRYSRNKLFILNINAYFDKRIETYTNDLKLSIFEFKEREIDFIGIYKQGVTQEAIGLFSKEIERKVTAYKDESKAFKRGYTGIAPIPFIMLAGTYLKRESINEYFEFDKVKQKYFKLNNRPRLFKEYPKLELQTDIDSISQNTDEIVLAIGLTTFITDNDLLQFGNKPIVRLCVPNPTDNIIQYKNQMISYRTLIYKVIEELKTTTSVKKIHLVYSGQSCLALEMGKVIEDNRMPEIINYHYQNQLVHKYPWGLVMNGNDRGKYINCN